MWCYEPIILHVNVLRITLFNLINVCRRYFSLYKIIQEYACTSQYALTDELNARDSLCIDDPRYVTTTDDYFERTGIAVCIYVVSVFTLPDMLCSFKKF